MNKEELQAKLKALPDNPGCYLMKDATDKIIYVGKAKSLKKRVKQYFTGAHDHKTTKMVSRIDDFDYVLTNTEKEALLLEINLIKQYTPQFNIMFMDDKSYPFIKLTADEYPALRVVREKQHDKNALYFGPYPDTLAARQTIQLLNQIYPLRKCRTMPKKACLYYYMNQCLGPCEFSIERDVYDRMRDQVVSVLRGDTRELIADLQTKMETASSALAFEKAQEYHELIAAVEHITDRQQVQSNLNIDQDVWSFYADKGYICVQLLAVRAGKLIRKKAVLNELYEDPAEAFLAYLGQYYQHNSIVKEVLLSRDIDPSLLADELSAHVIQPFRGHRRRLLDMAYDNAVEYHHRRFSVINTIDEQNYLAQDDLNRLLTKSINRIEVFDNSHLSGSDAVAGMVVFIDGRPSKKDYRRYQLHEGNDDVASMREVIYRRYWRLLKDKTELPDLVLVDGGYQQVRAADEVLASLYLAIPVLGMVKDDKHHTAGLMKPDGTLYDVDKDSALFFMITRIQDEVHRFAITYHRQKRLRSQTHSVLDDVPGVGDKRKNLLLRRFGSYKRLKEATVPEIAAVVPENTAYKVYEALHDEDDH